MFLKLAFAIVVAEAVTEIFVASALFDRLRKWVGGEKEDGLEGKFGLKGILVWCGYCVSVSMGVAFAFAFEIGLPFEVKWMPWWVGVSLVGIVVHRFSNLWHEAVGRFLKQTPFSLFLRLWRDGPEDKK